MENSFLIIGRIAAGVAHDLNNYLAVVGLSLAYVDRRAGDADVRNEVEQARQATERAMRLTRCLLEYARGGTPARTAVDVIVTVRRLLDVFRKLIPNGVKVIVEADPDAPEVVGVASELEQLVLNLILNACDAMPAGGELRLTVRATGAGGLTLEVADSGAGVPDFLASADGTLFPSTKAGRTGSGLGLGIVRGVADHHRATIDVGARPGGGTTIRVSFPPPR